jgi:hypothetical protein
MKPALSRSTLQVALVLVGATLVAVCEAPGIDKLIGEPWLHLIQILGGVLGGSQLIKRAGDFSPDQVEVVDGRQSVSPPQ